MFGGLRRGRAAAQAGAWAEATRAEAVRLAVIAETADACIEVRAFQARPEVVAQRGAIHGVLVELLRKQAGQGARLSRNFARPWRPCKAFALRCLH